LKLQQAGESVLVKPSTSLIRQLAAAILCLLPGVSVAQTGTITGQVFCSDTQKPARFARVRVTDSFFLSKTPNPDGSLFQRGRGGEHNEVHTLADGTFVLKDVPAGVYDLQITYPGYVDPGVWLSLGEGGGREIGISSLQSWLSLYTVVTVPAGRTVSAVATIYRGGELSGTVTYDDGSPASDIVVEPMMEMPSPAGDSNSGGSATIKLIRLLPRLHAVTDSHGRFLIHDLIDGTYTIKAEPAQVSYTAYFPTYLGNTIEQSEASLETIKAGSELSDLNIQINVSNLHHVRGVLMTVDGRPIAKENVALNLASGKEFGNRTTTAIDGSFSFSDVPDGHFRFIADAGTDSDQNSRHKSVNEPVTVSGSDITDLFFTASPER
jgi:hypothetical protein